MKIHTYDQPKESVDLNDLRPTTAISWTRRNKVNAREKVETTPNESEVFTEVEETRLLAEHEAGVDLQGDPAGTDVVLQGAEAATSLLTFT